MRGKFLHHLTMTTGHTRRSYRDEVADEAVDWARQAIRDAIVSGHVPLPPMGPQWRLACTREPSKALLCSVWRDEMVVATFGVAAHSRHGAKLWRALLETATRPIAVTECPPEPWVAVRLELGAAAVADDQPDALEMIADMERCVAWGFLEIIDEE